MSLAADFQGKERVISFKDLEIGSLYEIANKNMRLSTYSPKFDEIDSNILSGWFTRFDGEDKALENKMLFLFLGESEDNRCMFHTSDVSVCIPRGFVRHLRKVKTSKI